MLIPCGKQRGGEEGCEALKGPFVVSLPGFRLNEDFSWNSRVCSLRAIPAPKPPPSAPQVPVPACLPFAVNNPRPPALSLLSRFCREGLSGTPEQPDFSPFHLEGNCFGKGSLKVHALLLCLTSRCLALCWANLSNKNNN